ncbi:MAG: transposase [Verrucomicrobiota bacterium]
MPRASSSGVGKMTGTRKGTVATAWNARSNEFLAAFRARDLAAIDVVAVYFDGIFPGKERCVVVATAIDTEEYKHLLDFEEGSSESGVVVNGFLGRFAARGLVVGRDRRVLVLRDGSAAIQKRWVSSGPTRCSKSAWWMWSGWCVPSSPTSTSAGLWSR